MKKKMICMLLSLSMLCGIMSGCASKSSESETDSSNYVSNDSASKESASSDSYSYNSGTNECTDIYDPYYGGGNYYNDTEEYQITDESGFISTKQQPLSTFSADVDTASYSNLRRMIQDGYKLEDIPDGAVRIEELLNYFDYDYALPSGKEPFGVTTKITDCPWNAASKVMLVGLKTEEIDFDERPDSNLVFLIDVSGSMYDDDKLPLLIQSFEMLVENLTAKDRVSIVTYAGEDSIILQDAKGDETAKIRDALESMEAGGSTNGSAGIMTAYDLAEESFIKGGNNRVILATDGDLNVGLTSESELEELITEKKDSGVFLSVLGFGTGNIKDNKMEILADKGNGNYAYIDSITEARKVLVKEMGATLNTVAKDVKFQVEFNPHVVKSYRLIGYENRVLEETDFSDDTKDAGEIGAGKTVTALYEIITVDSSVSEAGTDLKYGSSSEIPDEEWLTVNIRYKKPDGDNSELLSYPVEASSYGEPDNDMKFAMSVAEFGLIVTDSAYKGTATFRDVTSRLKDTKLNDEYKEEFRTLIYKLED